MATNYSVIKFMGASVSDFNVSIGQGSTPSQLTVRLVEDRADGDSFLSPGIGKPAFFGFTHSGNAWGFNGLIQTQEKLASSNENPMYGVTLSDPREILLSSELILSNYNGSVNSVPNLLNPYGYIENSEGFGESEIKDGGIKWKKVINALSEMQESSGEYGGKLQYKGVFYTVNLSGLPQLPEDYRIVGDSISYFDLITTLAEDAGYEYNFTLEADNVITPQFISRLNEPELNLIDAFISSTPGAISKRVGAEARQDITSKFIVGANQVKLYGQTQQNTDNNDEEDAGYDEFVDDTIWPYWGHDSDGNLIIGEGVGDNHTIRLDTRHIDVPGVGESYTATVEELRYAAISQSSWESFLTARNDNRYKKVALGDFKNPLEYWDVDAGAVRLKRTTDFIRYNELRKAQNIRIHTADEYRQATGEEPYIKYRHNYEENPFFMRAAQLGIVGSFSHMVTTIFNEEKVNFDELISMMPLQFSPLTKTQLKFASYQDGDFTSEELRKELYDYLANYAKEYYAKKYMIRIPFVFVKIDEEEEDDIPTIDNIASGIGNIKTSMETTDAGYLDSSELSDAYNSNLIPYDIGKFQNQDGLIEAYVRFNDVSKLDLSGINEEDYALGKEYSYTETTIDENTGEEIRKEIHTRSVFVKCAVNPNLVFVDRETGYSPRAVIDLPAQIFDNSNYEDGSHHQGAAKKFLAETVENAAAEKETFDPDNYHLYFADQDAKKNVKALVDLILSRPGADVANEAISGLYRIPDFVAVPLKSNVDVYGPYYAVGADSKVDYEYDESLNPWNYGSYELMNRVGNAKVNDAITNQTWSESGIVEFPGLPAIALGTPLVNFGPYVTDIRVNVGAGGITTTYTMKSWTKRVGVESKQYIDRVKKLVKKQQDMKKKFRKLLKSPPPKGNDYYSKRERAYTKRADSNSSHLLLSGTVYGNNVSVSSQPNYHAVSNNYKNYYDSALVSLDVLFSPVSTNPYYSGKLPKFEEPADGALFPNATHLNPFPPLYPTSGDNDYFAFDGSGRYTNSIISVGDEPPQEGLINRDNVHLTGDCRIMAHRGPLVVHGWGYTTEGNPIPASTGDPTKFKENFLAEPTGWPIGPVDLRWDKQRKVWATGGNTRMGHLVRMSGIPYPDREQGFVPSGVMTDRTFHVYELTPVAPTTSGTFIEVSGEMIPVSGAYIEEVGMGYTYDSDGNKSSYVCKNFDPNLVIPSGNQSDGDILVITQNVGGYEVPIYVGCEF